VRTHLSKGLGFSKEDRDTNIRASDTSADCSPAMALVDYRGDFALPVPRDEGVEAVESDGASFVEIYLRAQLPALIRAM
jgi:adenylylsulfate kinase-like enzyme